MAPSKPSGSRIVALLLLAGLVAVIALTVDVGAGQPAQAQTFKGKSAYHWYVKYKRAERRRQWIKGVHRNMEKRMRQERRALLHRPSSIEAIRVAAKTYGASFQEMYNVAGCETGWTFDPKTKNRSSSASGLFQFLYPSTWNRTPYASESVWSPYANALAAAWLWKHDGKSWREWVCKP